MTAQGRRWSILGPRSDVKLAAQRQRNATDEPKGWSAFPRRSFFETLRSEESGLTERSLHDTRIRIYGSSNVWGMLSYESTKTLRHIETAKDLHAPLPIFLAKPSNMYPTELDLPDPRIFRTRNPISILNMAPLNSYIDAVIIVLHFNSLGLLLYANPKPTLSVPKHAHTSPKSTHTSRGARHPRSASEPGKS